MKKAAFALSFSLLLVTGAIAGAMGAGLVMALGAGLQQSLYVGGMIAAAALCRTTMRMINDEKPTHLPAAALTAAFVYVGGAFACKALIRKDFKLAGAPAKEVPKTAPANNPQPTVK